MSCCRCAQRTDRTYVAWPVDAFRLVTGGVANSAQVHTHLCCSEFGDVVEAIDGLDADVTTVEVARAKMEVLAYLGPGMPRARARDVRHALPTGARHRVVRTPHHPGDRLDRHPLRPVQPADLRPVLRCQSPSREGSLAAKERQEE